MFYSYTIFGRIWGNVDGSITNINVGHSHFQRCRRKYYRNASPHITRFPRYNFLYRWPHTTLVTSSLFTLPSNLFRFIKTQNSKESASRCKTIGDLVNGIIFRTIFSKLTKFWPSTIYYRTSSLIRNINTRAIKASEIK